MMKYPQLITCWRSVPMMLFRLKVILIVLIGGLLAGSHRPFALASDQNSIQTQSDLFKASIEDLMSIKITSVSKKTQKISEAPAAIYVITQEDIRRSGATSIPEALRMAPGLHVARIDASKWAVTSRGFNGFFANKLLVLIDGRSIYTPLFSGVFWHVQDVPLQDVERIEVIRGPGATLWGANAVNGVINILTKKAKDTQGNLLEAGFGNEESGFSTIRHGGNIDKRIDYRVYGKYFNRDESVFSSGDDAADDWDAFRSGFRLDYEPKSAELLTIQGDIYDISAGGTRVQAAAPPVYGARVTEEAKNTGANILFRWSHTLSDASGMTLQVYYDWTKMDDPSLDERRDTVDLDFQHRFSLKNSHEIIWGLGYRLTRDDIDNTFSIGFDPDSKSDEILSGFLQDDIAIDDYEMRLILGSKFEYNDYTGLEIQPNVRLLYKPHNSYSLWAALSRAVRTPSRAEHDVRINNQVIPPDAIFPGSLATYISMFGSEDFDSEELLAFELGYRVQATETLSIDIAAFFNVYDNLLTGEQSTPFLESSPLPPHSVIPLIANNKMDGNTYGVELVVDWRYSDRLTLKASYSYIQMQLHLDGDSTDVLFEDAEGDTPHHQISLRPSINLSKDLELDLWARYIDNLPSQDIGSYVSLDVRMAWKPQKNLELAVVAQNLLDDHRPEYEENLFLNLSDTEIERSIYGKITLHF